jgi:hypothetical protein
MNLDHLKILQQGVEAWNSWRVREPSIVPDLREADLNNASMSRANLEEAKLSRASLIGADLRGADLGWANLNWADLSGAYLNEANLRQATLGEAKLIFADLFGADLRKANLTGTSLIGADLREADLREADLRGVSLVEADISGANLTGCRIYGISAWGLKLSGGTKQQNLVITTGGKPEVTVDNLEIAQFVYLLLHNEKIRDVIDTITTKAVLILGRFTEERKNVLDAVREELRKHNYLPILFDFSIPASRDVTEMVKVLAGLARFVVADITDATEVRVELHNIIRDFPSVPVQPILLCGQPEFFSLQHLKKFPWVLPSFEYNTQKQLLADLDEGVIRPAEAKVLELRGA